MLSCYTFPLQRCNSLVAHPSNGVFAYRSKMQVARKRCFQTVSRKEPNYTCTALKAPRSVRESFVSDTHHTTASFRQHRVTSSLSNHSVNGGDKLGIPAKINHGTISIIVAVMSTFAATTLAHLSSSKCDTGEPGFSSLPSDKAQINVRQLNRGKSYDVSVRAIKGFRLYMEDEFFVAEGGRFVAIFDGHGGPDVSRYLRNNLYKKMRYYLYDETEDEYLENFKNHKFSSLSAIINKSEYPPNRSPSIARICMAFRSSIRAIEREVLSHQLLRHQGSTAVAVALHEGNNGLRTLISANVGDSRAILSRRGQAVDLTRDHKPNDPKEKARVLSMGDNVEYDGYGGVWRVRGLSVSRAIGDGYAKPILSGEVEIKRFPLAEEGADEFIVLASDGLWDVMSSQEVVNYVHGKIRAPVPADENVMMTNRMRRRHISRYLSNEAMRRGSGDNISVIVVWLAGDLT